MVLAVKVSSAALLPSAEVGERTVSLVSRNPLLSGNPRSYLINGSKHISLGFHSLAGPDPIPASIFSL